MILWLGWQVPVVIFVLVSQAVAFVLATQVSGNPDYTDLHGWPLGVGSFASAVMCWLLDLHMTKEQERARRDQQTASSFQEQSRASTLHPVRWCAAGMVLIDILCCCYHRTPEQLWRYRQPKAARLESISP